MRLKDSSRERAIEPAGPHGSTGLPRRADGIVRCIESARKRSNCFDIIRLLAASFVLIGHQYVLFGRLSDIPTALHSSISTFGVKVFFAVSGFLIAQSWETDPHLGRFWIKRILRIWPGLIGVVFFCLVVIGPIFTTRTFSDYIHSGQTSDYLNNIIMYITYQLPGVFEKAPVPAAVNGSLWSLPIEIFMYIILPVFLFASRKSVPMRRAVVFVALIIFSVAKTWGMDFAKDWHPVVYGSPVVPGLELSVYFLSGTLIFLLFPLHVPRLSISILLLFFLNYNSNIVFLHMIDGFGISYIVVAFAYAKWPWARRLENDYSYGMYLYAFPVQQMLYQLLPKTTNWWVAMSASFALTFALAFASWHLVEIRAVRARPFLESFINLRASKAKA